MRRLHVCSWPLAEIRKPMSNVRCRGYKSGLLNMMTQYPLNMPMRGAYRQQEKVERCCSKCFVWLTESALQPIAANLYRVGAYL